MWEYRQPYTQEFLRHFRQGNKENQLMADTKQDPDVLADNIHASLSMELDRDKRFFCQRIAAQGIFHRSSFQ